MVVPLPPSLADLLPLLKYGGYILDVPRLLHHGYESKIGSDLGHPKDATPYPPLAAFWWHPPAVGSWSPMSDMGNDP